MARILVTGGSGFIGKHLTERLVKDGHEVTITSSGAEQTIPGVHKVLYMSLEGIDWNYVYNQDVVFHQMANNDTRCQDEEEMQRANVHGPITLFHKALKGGCRNFVYASSTAVYGASPAPYIEGITRTEPLNAYGRSKLEFDQFAPIFARERKVKVTALRYCNVYGPGEDHKAKRMSMVGQILRHILHRVPPVLFEPGDQKRDWIYVSDVVEMNILAMDREIKEGESFFKVYNCGSGTAHTFNEIVDIINDLLLKKKRIKPRYIPCSFKEQYQNHTECCIEKARAELGFSPRFDLRSGIREYLSSFTYCDS